MKSPSRTQESQGATNELTEDIPNEPAIINVAEEIEAINIVESRDISNVPAKTQPTQKSLVTLHHLLQYPRGTVDREIMYKRTKEQLPICFGNALTGIMKSIMSHDSSWICFRACC
jgi:hypothetical protein